MIYITSYLFSKVGVQLQHAPTFSQASRSINPFDVNSEAALVQPPMVGQSEFILHGYNFPGPFLLFEMFFLLMSA